MQKIDNLSDDAQQISSIVLPDGSAVEFFFNFLPATQRWTVDFTHGTFTAQGINLCLHPNLFRTWKNKVPFGLGIASNDGLDPVEVSDFTEDRVQLYVLTKAEVDDIENTVFKPA